MRRRPTHARRSPTVAALLVCTNRSSSADKPRQRPLPARIVVDRPARRAAFLIGPVDRHRRGDRAANAAMGKGDATEKSAVAFTKETAKTSGKDERTIRQAARRGKELGSDLHKIAGTSLDKGVEMDALIKMDEPERLPLAWPR